MSDFCEDCESQDDDGCTLNRDPDWCRTEAELKAADDAYDRAVDARMED
jgi:hypothetical protein